MLVLFFLSLQAFADGPVSLAPTWKCPYEEIPLNYSYLYNIHNSPTDFATKFFGDPKKVKEIKQQYDDQTRSYYDHKLYGDSDLQSSYFGVAQLQSANQNTYNSTTNAIRVSQSAQYIQNLRDSNDRGTISDPIKYTAGVTAVLTGNTVDTDIGTSKLSTNTNLSNQTGFIKLDTSYYGVKVNFLVNVSPGLQTGSAKTYTDYGTMSANVTPSAPKDPASAQAINQELYILSYSKTIPVIDLNLGTSYAGSTQICKITISRSIYRALMAEIDNSSGNTSINILPDTVYKISYAIHF